MNVRILGLLPLLALVLIAGCASDEALFAEYDALCRQQVCLRPGSEVMYERVEESLHWEPAVYFGFDLDTLETREKERIEDNVAVLNKYSDLQINLQAFTDVRGTFNYNIDLSDRRRQRVFDYLVELGVSEDRIVMSIAGEMLPILVEDTIEQRAINRRVEMMLLDASGRPLSFTIAPSEKSLEPFVPPTPSI